MGCMSTRPGHSTARRARGLHARGQRRRLDEAKGAPSSAPVVGGGSASQRVAVAPTLQAVPSWAVGDSRAEPRTTASPWRSLDHLGDAVAADLWHQPRQVTQDRGG